MRGVQIKVLRFFTTEINLVLCYMLLGFLFITPLVELKGLMSISSKLMLIWGLAMVIYYAIQGKFKANVKVYFTLVLFLLVQIISILVNRANINISVILVNLILFFAIFNMSNKKQAKISIEKICSTMANVAGILGVISIIIYFSNLSIVFYGVTFGRIAKLQFSGVYSNPNTLGIISLFSIIMILILISIRKNKTDRIILISNIICQFFLLYISDCSSALLGLAVFVLCIVFFLLRKNIFRIMYLAVIIIPSVVFIIRSYKNYKLMDYLNGRFDLWKAAINVSKQHLFFGVGNGNLVDVVKHSTKLQLWGIDAGGLHNIFFQVLVSNGVIALLIFIIFIVVFVVKGFSIISKLQSQQRLLAIKLFAFEVAILSVNCFEANMLYVVSFISIIFWAILGYFFSLEDR
ncbi:O-antigen ligase family protein [Inconstantimicrobium mannanitabidum]|uniref:Ligase n=1 Tax=Inconstantimicrobium mannanitabidum TaxID=1604901 RepID=A0ACB5RAQ5_9CLOT|nr:O-antigen ligase family protein [Clostridium sp. TW13]GKX66109.1 ligase [Clostridium sp. TW13]